MYLQLIHLFIYLEIMRFIMFYMDPNLRNMQDEMKRKRKEKNKNKNKLCYKEDAVKVQKSLRF